MPIRIQKFAIDRHDIATRMPFKYGIATMSRLPHIFFRVTADFSGTPSEGIAADHLPPKWFTKDPDRDPLHEIDDMLRVIRRAGDLAKETNSETVFGFWLQLYRKQAEWATAEGIPPLLAHFGTSIVERAMIDAFCRIQGKPFFELLKNNAFGIDFGALRPELANSQPSDFLPPRPLDSIQIRHTVGLSDAIRESELAATDRLDDGLPQSLEACIQFYGINSFKIKVQGDRSADFARLRSIADLFDSIGLSEFSFSLDGNEQFQDFASFRTAWDSWLQDPSLQSFFRKLLFVEQPLNRSVALNPEIGDSLRPWKDAPLIVIDESDAELDSLPRALEIGYRGTSHKNCKGVFKGILNRATLTQLNRKADRDRYYMSGEDLANIGPVANHQDLLVQATLGNDCVERNGHHYFKGLSVFGSNVQEEALRHFPKLYCRDPNDYVRLRINHGRLEIADLFQQPFGANIPTHL